MWRSSALIAVQKVDVREQAMLHPHRHEPTWMAAAGSGQATLRCCSITRCSAWADIGAQ